MSSRAIAAFCSNLLFFIFVHTHWFNKETHITYEQCNSVKQFQCKCSRDSVVFCMSSPDLLLQLVRKQWMFLFQVFMCRRWNAEILSSIEEITNFSCFNLWIYHLTEPIADCWKLNRVETRGIWVISTGFSLPFFTQIQFEKEFNLQMKIPTPGFYLRERHTQTQTRSQIVNYKKNILFFCSNRSTDV